MEAGNHWKSVVREIACQMVPALYYLHSCHILHGDLKPVNILLGKGGVVKLCNFGFTQSLSAHCLVFASMKGTPLYMSLDFLKGLLHKDPQKWLTYSGLHHPFVETELQTSQSVEKLFLTGNLAPKLTQLKMPPPAHIHWAELQVINSDGVPSMCLHSATFVFMCADKKTRKHLKTQLLSSESETVMENYHIMEKIGEGSFGKVYKGRRKFSRQIVALKFISKVGQSAKQLRSLKCEIEIMRGLKHPNIIQLLDSFDTRTEIVIVTEYAEGDLFTILVDDECLPESQVREIACQMVSALYYLHSRRILHRDLKPMNILLGKGGVVKLCDFGFARTMSASTLVLTSMKGTPLYMSPELVEHKPYDHSADLWALGCILYELHTGNPPFYSTSIYHISQQIINDPIKWPNNMSQDCMSFLKGLLNKDPQKRLTWPGLLHHSFVADRITDENLYSHLTRIPSPHIQLKKQKNEEDQSKCEKALVNSPPHIKTAAAKEAPNNTHLLGRTFTIIRCQNSDGVARVSSIPYMGPISIDYEREFLSLAVGPIYSEPGHTSMAPVKMDNNEQEQLAEVTDHISVPGDLHIHQKLMINFLRCKKKLLNGKLEEPSTILRLVKILKNIIRNSSPADARKIGEEMDVLHILFSLMEVILNSSDVMKKSWSERVLAELMAVLLPIWENQPDWRMKEKRAEDLCLLLTSLFPHPEQNVLAPQAAAVLRLFIHYGVHVNIHMDLLTAILQDLLSRPEKPPYPLPAGWGMCDGVLELIRYFLSESESALYQFLNSEVWCHLWTKVDNILESKAAKPEYLSVDGFAVLLSIALLIFTTEPYDSLFLFFDDDKKLIRTLIRLLTTECSTPLKRGLLWGSSDMNSLAVMSCQLLCFPFELELPQDKMAVILNSYESLNIVQGLVQVVQLQSPALLEFPLFLLCRLCISSPKYAVPSFISAAQDCGFLPRCAPSDQIPVNINESGSSAEQPRLKKTLHKNQVEMGKMNGDDPKRTTDIIEGNISKSRDMKDPPNVYSQLSKSMSGKVGEKGFHSKTKQDLKFLNTAHFQDSIEQQSDDMEEFVDSLESQNDVAAHHRHLSARHTSTKNWLIDSLEQPKNCKGHSVVSKMYPKTPEVKCQSPKSEFRTASSLLSMLLQTKSLFGCAVKILNLLSKTCMSGSALSVMPVDLLVLRAAICHCDDGVRESCCKFLSCLEPDMGHASPQSSAEPNWTIEPAVFKDLLSCLSDSAPSVRRIACKAAVKWLGMMSKTEVTSRGDQHLQKGTEYRRRTIHSPVVTDRGRMNENFEDIRQEIKCSSLNSDGTCIESEWLKVTMEAASPVVSLLSDSDAVIRKQGCIIIEHMAAIPGGERALMSANAPYQLLCLAFADTHYAVRQQAVSALCAFSQQDALRKELLGRFHASIT